MKIIRAAAGRAFAQSLAQLFRALRAGEKSFEQGAQVQSGSAHDDRQMAARLDLLEHLPRLARIFAGRDVVRGLDAIEQMMRGAGSFGGA